MTAARLYLDHPEEFEAALEEEQEARHKAVRIIQAAEKLGYHLTENSRDPEIVTARNACARLLRERGLTLTEIGRLLGRQYSAVVHMLGKVADWELMPKMYAKELAVLEAIRKEVEK